MKRGLVLLFFLFLHSAYATPARYLSGNRANVTPKKLYGPANLFGGGGDVDNAIQWMIDEVRGCKDCDAKVDVLVLRSSGADGYNETIMKMRGVDSIESIVFDNKKDANTKEIEDTVNKAEVIFFAGGDQCRHLRFFEGTRLQKAVQAVYDRGGGVGGSSAGLAILSPVIYDACRGSTKSEEALSDPYHSSISFAYDFLKIQNMRNTYADQHVVARNRIGRTLTFLARQLQDGKTDHVWGLAVNEDSSLVVDKNGLGTVMGAGPVHLILADHKPEVCKPKTPLTYSNFKMWRFDSGKTIDLKNKPTEGFYLRSVTKGKLSADPYTP